MDLREQGRRFRGVERSVLVVENFWGFDEVCSCPCWKQMADRDAPLCLEIMAATPKGRVGAVLCFLLMALLGAPFKWNKQRGGWVTEWV